MSRPVSPPEMEFFRAARPRLGPERMEIALGSLGLALDGLTPELRTRLLERYETFVAPPGDGGSGALQVAVFAEDREYFIDPPARPEFNPIRLACDGTRVRYLGYRVAGWFDTLGGRGELLLARGAYEPADRALENYIRASVAWQASSRGGALVHAASAVWRGRGYLFYGESGAGKSTLSACNRRARVVSDDLSLVLPASDGRLQLVGSPFRGTYEEGQPVIGSFPLVAGFRIIQDRSADVRPASRTRAMAELVGNLPFVAEAFERRPDLFDALVRAFDGLPLAHLHFAKDDTYWDAIERAGM